MADPSPAPLAELAMRAKKGDRKAFEQIVHATARLVYAHVVAIVRDRQKAEDLTQETYVAAWKGIAGLDGAPQAATVRERQSGEGGEKDKNRGGMTGGLLVAWLLTVARNTTLDAVKAESRLKRGGGKPASAGEKTGELADQQQGSPAESAQRAEEVAHAISVLEDLPEEYRRVLSMRYLAGADYDTIRRALDLTDGALRGLLSRGMALMRERMTRTGMTNG